MVAPLLTIKRHSKNFIIVIRTTHHPLGLTIFLPLCVTLESVLEALKAFPRASSPGFSKLRAQHLLEAVQGTSTPSAQECLETLIRWVNLALPGKMETNSTMAYRSSTNSFVQEAEIKVEVFGQSLWKKTFAG